MAVEACVDAVSARCDAAAEKARAALDSGLLTDFHAMMASVALTMALGALGEVDDLTTVAPGGARPRHHVVPGIAYAVLVRQRLRPRMPADRPDRRMRGDGGAACRLGARGSEPGLRQPGVPDGLRRTDARRCPDRRETPARGARRRRKARCHNRSAPRHLLRAGRGARETRRGGGRQGSDRRGAVLRPARLPVHADRAEHRHRLGRWPRTAASPRRSRRCSRPRCRRANAISRRTNSPACRWPRSGATLPERCAPASSPTSWGCRWPMPLPDTRNHWPPTTAKDCSRRRANTRRSVTARPPPMSPRRRPSRSRADQQRKRGLYAAAVAKELSDACGGLCTPALRSPASQPLDRASARDRRTGSGRAVQP